MDPWSSGSQSWPNLRVKSDSILKLRIPRLVQYSFIWWSVRYSRKRRHRRGTWKQSLLYSEVLERESHYATREWAQPSRWGESPRTCRLVFFLGASGWITQVKVKEPRRFHWCLWMLLGHHGQRRAGKGTYGRGQPYQPGVPGHLGQGAYSLLVEMLRQWGKYF